jgi:hypothetical protein
MPGTDELASSCAAPRAVPKLIGAGAAQVKGTTLADATLIPTPAIPGIPTIRPTRVVVKRRFMGGSSNPAEIQQKGKQCAREANGFKRWLRNRIDPAAGDHADRSLAPLSTRFQTQK